MSNRVLVEFIRSHDTNAWENSDGTVTMENRFFNAPSEYVQVANLTEARIQLNY